MFRWHRVLAMGWCVGITLQGRYMVCGVWARLYPFNDALRCGRHTLQYSRLCRSVPFLSKFEQSHVFRFSVLSVCTYRYYMNACVWRSGLCGFSQRIFLCRNILCRIYNNNCSQSVIPMFVNILYLPRSHLPVFIHWLHAFDFCFNYVFDRTCVLKHVAILRGKTIIQMRSISKCWSSLFKLFSPMNYPCCVVVKPLTCFICKSILIALRV